MKYCYVLSVLAIVLLLISCAPRNYLPVTENNVERSGEYAVLRLDSSMLAATVSFWTVEPRFLSDYYTTISVRIQNRTSESMTIMPSDFAIIDQNNRQFDIVPTETVLEMMLLDPSLIPDRFVISAETQRENEQRRNTIRRNILARGFSFGAVHPGAFKEGVLFFPRLDGRHQEFTLVYKGNEIKFRRSR